jgi:DNA polymerase II small subunit/DNA polymerase delta subunit B
LPTDVVGHPGTHTALQVLLFQKAVRFAKDRTTILQVRVGVEKMKDRSPTRVSRRDDLSVAEATESVSSKTKVSSEGAKLDRRSDKRGMSDTTAQRVSIAGTNVDAVKKWTKSRYQRTSTTVKQTEGGEGGEKSGSVEAQNEGEGVDPTTAPPCQTTYKRHAPKSTSQAWENAIDKKHGSLRS